MKSIYVAACLFVCLWPALAAEKREEQTSAPVEPGTNGEDKPFSDPFASGSEHPRTEPKIKDPLQPMNRAFFHFNDKLYLWVVKPAGKGYTKVVPRPARTCVGRFLPM